MQDENNSRSGVELNISREFEKSYQIAKALASPVRLRILELLGKKSMNVNELSRALQLPLSTTAMNIKQLDEANLIITELKPGARGAVKLCSLFVTDLHFKLAAQSGFSANQLTMEMPVGGFSYAHHIQGDCGVASSEAYIGMPNDVGSFYDVDRFRAGLLWFKSGFLEYNFSRFPIPNAEIEFIELTFEACSEAKFYCNAYLSDISVYINGVKLGTWTSPGDFGGRRGQYTPMWWNETGTQFGMLKKWLVSSKGTTLDGAPISEVCLAALDLGNAESISVQIGVEADAEHVGGMNLFGKSFGDYAQDIILRIGYKDA